jgi:hypothetical protein
MRPGGDAGHVRVVADHTVREMSVNARVRRTLLVAAVMALLIGACDAGEWTGGSSDDARRIAGDFLAAVKAGDSDGAWSLFYPPSRSAVFGDDRARFDAALAAIDLSGVTWEATAAWEHDGHYHVTVRFDPFAVDDDLDIFLQLREDDALMQVDIEPLGGAAGVVGG